MMLTNKRTKQSINSYRVNIRSLRGVNVSSRETSPAKLDTKFVEPFIPSAVVIYYRLTLNKSNRIPGQSISRIRIYIYLGEICAKTAA